MESGHKLPVQLMGKRTDAEHSQLTGFMLALRGYALLLALLP